MNLADPNPRDIEQAVLLFKAFQHRGPRAGEIVELGAKSKTTIALAVGECISIGYRALGDRKNYYHEFEGNRPRLFVNAIGDQLFVVGGIYRFKSCGFVK